MDLDLDLDVNPDAQQRILEVYSHHNQRIDQQLSQFQMMKTKLQNLVNEGNQVLNQFLDNAFSENPSMNVLRTTSYTLTNIRADIARRKNEIYNLHNAISQLQAKCRELEAMYFKQAVSAQAIAVNSVDTARILSSFAQNFGWSGRAVIPKQIVGNDRAAIVDALVGIPQTRID